MPGFDMRSTFERMGASPEDIPWMITGFFTVKWTAAALLVGYGVKYRPLSSAARQVIQRQRIAFQQNVRYTEEFLQDRQRLREIYERAKVARRAGAAQAREWQELYRAQAHEYAQNYRARMQSDIGYKGRALRGYYRLANSTSQRLSSSVQFQRVSKFLGFPTPQQLAVGVAEGLVMAKVGGVVLIPTIAAGTVWYVRRSKRLRNDTTPARTYPHAG